MPKRPKKHDGQHLQLREIWVIFFIMGVIFMNYPFIHIFNKGRMVLGLPLLFFYLLSGWAVSIGIIYLFTKVAGKNGGGRENGERR